MVKDSTSIKMKQFPFRMGTRAVSRISRLLILFGLFLILPASAEDWTVNGKDYYNVKVGQVEADRVHITYDGGIGTVLIADLPQQLKKRLNYNPAAAKATIDERNQQEAQADATLAAQTKQEGRDNVPQLQSGGRRPRKRGRSQPKRSKSPDSKPSLQPSGGEH